MRRSLSVLLLLTAAVCNAQIDAGGYHLGPVDASGYPRKLSVVLEVGITDADRTRQTKASDVHATIDGQHSVSASGLTPFRDTGQGMAIVIAVDVSPSMAAPLASIKAAVGRAVAETTPKDHVALVSFADDEVVEVPFTAETEKIRATLPRLQIRGRATQMYRVVVKALQMFEREPRLPARRRIVIISDGKDYGSSYRLEDVIEMEARHRVPVDTIAVAREGMARTVDQSALERLSDATGGNYRFAPSPDVLGTVVANGMRWLQGTPVAVFQFPESVAADGQRHALAVQWAAFGGQRTSDFISPPAPSQPVSSYLWWIGGGVGVLAAAGLLVWSVRRRSPVQPLPATSSGSVAVPSLQVQQAEHAATAAFDVKPGRIPTIAERSVPPADPLISSVPVEIVPQPVTPAAAPRKRLTMIRSEFRQPEPGQPAVWLIIKGGPSDGEKIAVDQPSFWIGAGENNQLVLQEDTVSWNHACLVFEHSDLYLWDDSTNGTVLNGRLLKKERARLNPNDVITIGSSSIRLAADI